MYKQIKATRTSIKGAGEQLEGETIEKKVRRITQNKEPIKDGAPIIYTDRKDGVNPQYNIRTDRWEHAVEAKDYIQKTKIAEREQRHKPKDEKPNPDIKPGDLPNTGGIVGEAQPIGDDKGCIMYPLY